MATLREIKDRIGSVRSTLKITSAMKLVASSKLRKAQSAIEALRPYEAALQGILSSIPVSSKSPAAGDSPAATEYRGDAPEGEHSAPGNDIIVAIASNSSLCGGFNANAVRKALSVAKEGTVVYSLGRKMAEAMKKEGYASPEDLNSLVAHPGYAEAARLSDELFEMFREGRVSKVTLVYNHFVSTSRQEAVAEQYLPFEVEEAQDSPAAPDCYILEPDAGSILQELTPKVLRLKLYAAILDSVAAEHAARAVAMQTATDNATDLLDELTLEYNKGRQQKITAEILDLAGGAAAQ